MKVDGIGPAVVVMLALCGSIVAASPRADTEKVPIFVKSGAAASGFTDPSKDRQDSARDLCNRIRDSKLVRVANSERDALVVLEVLRRETRLDTNGWARAFGAHQSKSSVMVRLTAGRYSTEFSGESSSLGELTSYGAAAGKIVKQLEDWVKANREQLALPR